MSSSQRLFLHGPRRRIAIMNRRSETVQPLHGTRGPQTTVAVLSDALVASAQTTTQTTCVRTPRPSLALVRGLRRLPQTPQGLDERPVVPLHVHELQVPHL